MQMITCMCIYVSINYIQKHILIIIILTAALVSPIAPLDNKNLITLKRLYKTALDNGVSLPYNNNIISK